MRKLTEKEKEALKAKIKEAGLDETSKIGKITISEEKKEEMKKLIAEEEHKRLEKLDKGLHAREKKKKEDNE
ncbi:hypothetical protein GF312_18605 [Candidatus Poribacteria bacterium]|nr:hypothetical protein [Candidatus Poribacteria bacterium]